MGEEVKKQEQLNAQDRLRSHISVSDRWLHSDKSGPSGSPCILDYILKQIVAVTVPHLFTPPHILALG